MTNLSWQTFNFLDFKFQITLFYYLEKKNLKSFNITIGANKKH